MNNIMRKSVDLNIFEHVLNLFDAVLYAVSAQRIETLVVLKQASLADI